MFNTLFIDNTYYHLTDDIESLRKLNIYQQVRDEINRRFNPLAGGTDWEVVRSCCETMAKGPGLDLLMCGYFTVANLKTLGLSGYANGLELLNMSASNLSKPDVKSASMRKEVLDWVNARAVQELKDLRPNYESLRDLYRCERYCERIHRLIEQQQPEYEVNFDGVGFALFEHIDRIETQYYSLVKRHPQQEGIGTSPVSFSQYQQQQSPPQQEYSQHSQQSLRRQYRQWFLGAFLIGGLVFGGGVWLYQQLPWFHTNDYSQRITVATLSNSEQLLRFQQGVSTGQLARWKNDFIDLYSHSVQTKMAQSNGFEKLEALNEIMALKALYPDDRKVSQVSEQFDEAQQSALEQTEIFVQRFSEIRTKMANIALLAKRERWEELQKQTKSLEEFAVSLSPIYGRLSFVQTLIKQGDLVGARKELSILNQRLNQLNWKIAQLEQELSEPEVAR